MNKTKNIGQRLTWEQPRPIRQQVRKYPAKDGASIPNSVTEDIGGFSIAPWYSLKQLRRINDLRTRKIKYGHKNTKACIHAPHRQYIIKQAFNQEAII
jgi:hypothetical protein